MSNKIKTGLFFGSFNPIHVGHMIIAQYMQQFAGLQEVWFVVSPQNPLKDKSTLIDDHHRLLMVKLAAEGNPALKVSDVEFSMPRPSYTIDTLKKLSEVYPGRDFVLIAGADVFADFHKWKSYRELLDNWLVYVYNRPGYTLGDFALNPNIRQFEAPLLSISSTFLRGALSSGKDMRYMLPAPVWDYICEKKLYR
jgi:nicotinate-nucleotide adenylyltransferase